LLPLTIGLGGVALLAVAMFGDMLIAPGSRVLGNIQRDQLHAGVERVAHRGLRCPAPYRE
jgi:hypothetical protein